MIVDILQKNKCPHKKGDVSLKQRRERPRKMIGSVAENAKCIMLRNWWRETIIEGTESKNWWKFDPTRVKLLMANAMQYKIYCSMFAV